MFSTGSIEKESKHSYSKQHISLCFISFLSHMNINNKFTFFEKWTQIWLVTMANYRQISSITKIISHRKEKINSLIFGISKKWHVLTFFNTFLNGIIQARENWIWLVFGYRVSHYCQSYWRRICCDLLCGVTLIFLRSSVWWLKSRPNLAGMNTSSPGWMSLMAHEATENLCKNSLNIKQKLFTD